MVSKFGLTLVIVDTSEWTFMDKNNIEVDVIQTICSSITKEMIMNIITHCDKNFWFGRKLSFQTSLSLILQGFMKITESFDLKETFQLGSKEYEYAIEWPLKFNGQNFNLAVFPPSAALVMVLHDTKSYLLKEMRKLEILSIGLSRLDSVIRTFECCKYTKIYKHNRDQLPGKKLLEGGMLQKILLP
ncbi:32985_t:CDS:2 [Gigaspora margarita]|uniref:32985_t:CDS:1 n=1 Tax=Gigaspora margarita TaxID=4874 RepID=A0ABM8W284_GIGMA|nr:32985_t:CDS:2 [Gigaspora margarita]